MKVSQRAVRAILDTARDPEWFFMNILGKKPTPAALAHGYTSPLTPDQQLIAASVRDNKYTLVEAAVGVGKTALAGWLVLWFITTHPGSKVITTAPTALQVEQLLWSEIAKAYMDSRVPLGGKLLQTKLEFAPDWFAIGLSPARGAEEQTAVRFQGFHAPQIMIIFDEAVGIHSAIWEAGEGLAVGPDDRWLAITNPTDPTSECARQSKSGTWNVIRVSGLDHPNVIHDDPWIVPGAISRSWVEERIKKYDNDIDNPLYRSKVLGLWPNRGIDMLFSIDWLRNAQKRWVYPEGLAVASGCDVARYGDDETVIQDIFWDGTFAIPDSFSGQSTEVTARMMMDRDVEMRVIDDIGVGAGVTDKLLNAGYGVYPFVGNGKAEDSNTFGNIRAEAYWYFREGMRKGMYTLPPSDQIFDDISEIRYTYDGRGHIIMEDKAKIKRRLKGRSPDFADAAMLAAWGHKIAHIPTDEHEVLIGGDRTFAPKYA